MNYEVKNIQNQSYGDEIGITSEAVVFMIEYTKDTYKNSATLEFPRGTTEQIILAKIESYGKELLANATQEYTFPKTGTIN